MFFLICKRSIFTGEGYGFVVWYPDRLFHVECVESIQKRFAFGLCSASSVVNNTCVLHHMSLIGNCCASNHS